MWCYIGVLVLTQTSLIFSASLPLLLIVSFDGFRHDYSKIHGPLKNFQRLKESGVHAREMIPTFTTATFPNHYTIITGLYEETHGLISNHIFDPKTKMIFDASKDLFIGDWWTHPSIFSLNEQRKEDGRRTGVIAWPQDPVHVSKFEPYGKERPFRDVIDRVLNWFNDPKEPINFGAIYFFEPDYTGHRTGPFSENMTKVVRECDEHLGYLLDRIDSDNNLRDNLHVIVMSDHGMQQVNGTNSPLYIENYIDPTRVKAFGVGPAMNLFVESKTDINVVLKNLSKIPHSRVYLRSDIPERFHYKNHDRVGDILLTFEPGYEIHHLPAYGGKRYNLSNVHGTHGYDNNVDSMKAIFYARGPQFKRNFTLPESSSLRNVDLFSLMCILLSIDDCPPSNGSSERVQSFFADPSRIRNLNRVTESRFSDLFVYLMAFMALCLILTMAIIWSGTSLHNSSTMNGNIRMNVTRPSKHDAYEFSQINNPQITSTIDIDHS